jgi:hypothetical protein
MAVVSGLFAAKYAARLSPPGYCLYRAAMQGFWEAFSSRFGQSEPICAPVLAQRVMRRKIVKRMLAVFPSSRDDKTADKAGGDSHERHGASRG